MLAGSADGKQPLHHEENAFTSFHAGFSFQLPRPMSVKVRYTSALVTGVVLAKVGNPQREEPLQTSKEIFRVDENDRVPLTTLLLRPFKNLIAHRFSHHSSLSKHEMNQCAKAIFGNGERLLDKGWDIATRLYTKSTHPNIKSGDLCIALIEGIEIDGEMKQGLCILKSETMTPFLTITTRDGDLHLTTEQGITPEKIDKGCLILDHSADQGYYVLTFDRAGAESRFWVRDFLGLQAVPDAAFLTDAYAKMAVAALEPASPPSEDDDTPPWETKHAAREALDYFEDRDTFSLETFESEVLKTPEAVARFKDERTRLEEEHGLPLDTDFEIAKKQVSKVKRKLNSVLKLDTGVEIHIKAGDEEPVLERGFDPAKSMKFIKVFFHQDISAS